MQVKCEVSLGELVDKLTILKIKTEKIIDPIKNEYALQESKLLEKILSELKLDGVEAMMGELKKVNEELWLIEDLIRDKEKEKKFDAEFIELARRVYQTNDKRFKIKNEINFHFGSAIKEVKSYQEY